MLNLWTQRKRAHFLEMLKYLRYVLNDHFVIALMFLVGGLGFGYSNFLKSFHAGTWWAGPVTIICLTVILQFCSLATLLKRADPVFLLPREHDMHAYLKKARIHSWIFSTIVEVIGTIILFPFMAIAFKLPTAQIAGFAIVLIILKYGSLSLELNQLYQNQVFGWQKRLLANWILPLIWFTGGIYLGIWFALIGAVIQSFIEIRREQQQWQTRSLSWTLAVNLEDQRMLKIYRFFNLFTDVPNVHGTVHRRKYLDRILAIIDQHSNNPYVYLFSRALMRSTVYSGLYFRLTALGVVLLIFISNVYLSIFLQLLFVYLIGFQLLPLFANYDENVFTHLYPISVETKAAGFNWLVAILLEFTVSLLAIVAGISNLSILQTVITWIVGSIEVWALLKFYFPIRIKKMNS
ncbi:ABC transporter permease [Pediococcus damnosus]|uniref:ABC transporter permease n=1 Tax=Pediococcus damnosus TaxID=51663 RepID=UPI0007B84A7F|nr:ABC transporter permease [Pediococcus damnosus]